jgi:hypothetical protein
MTRADASSMNSLAPSRSLDRPVAGSPVTNPHPIRSALTAARRLAVWVSHDPMTRQFLAERERDERTLHRY